MKRMKLQDVIDRALAAGGSMAEIERQAQNLRRSAGSIPQKNMIVALNLHPWLNDASDWMRLAAAMKAERKQA